MSPHIDILYEDNHLIAVNKAAGVLVQGDQTGDQALPELVKHYLKSTYNKPGNVFCGVIHRIDRPVSGVVVMAKTSKALSRMTQLFQQKQVRKTYWAVSEEQPERDSGHLIHFLAKDEAKNRVHAYERKRHGAKLSELSYELKAVIGGCYLLEVNPITGRPHQIRVQLAKMGCPIQGDLKYGAKHRNRDKSISLHAREISFEHPVKKEPIRITASLPETTDWQRFQGM